MNEVRAGLPRFDRGIDKVIDEGQWSEVRLPDGGSIAPTQVAAVAQLAELLDRPNLEAWLEDSIQPILANPGVLAPLAFQAALVAARNLFRKRKLARAADVLDEEIDLRDQLYTYLRALVAA